MYVDNSIKGLRYLLNTYRELSPPIEVSDVIDSFRRGVELAQLNQLKFYDFESLAPYNQRQSELYDRLLMDRVFWGLSFGLDRLLFNDKNDILPYPKG